MILRQSLFDVVLDRVGQDRACAPDYPARVAISGLTGSLTGAKAVIAPMHTANQLNEAYFAFSNDDAVPVHEPEFDSAAFERVEFEEIEQDLNLNASDTRAELQGKRRDFARLNHPDRVPENWRGAASIRMKTANLLIDKALVMADLKSA